MTVRYLKSALIGLLVAMLIFGTIMAVRHFNQPASRPTSQTKERSAALAPPTKRPPEGGPLRHLMELSITSG